MPRLNCSYAEFIAIIEAHGFVLHRHGATSHVRYRGIVGNRVRMVDVAAHRRTDLVKPATLHSMIRQSGLPKKLFMK